MSILITFIKLLAIFDLLVIAVYFGSDILSTVWSKFRKKPIREEPFDFSLDTAAVPLSIDSIRQLYSGDAADFVEERLAGCCADNGSFGSSGTDSRPPALIRTGRLSGRRSPHG